MARKRFARRVSMNGKPFGRDTMGVAAAIRNGRATSRRAMSRAKRVETRRNSLMATPSDRFRTIDRLAGAIPVSKRQTFFGAHADYRGTRRTPSAAAFAEPLAGQRLTCARRKRIARGQSFAQTGSDERPRRNRFRAVGVSRAVGAHDRARSLAPVQADRD